MKSLKVIFVNLFFVIGIFISFEFLVRRFVDYDSFYYGMRESNDSRKYNLHPYGKIPINSNGFFDKEWDYPKTKKRFGYTGDSVVYGVGTGYPYRLTEYLDYLQPDIEHINISKGIGTNILSMGNEGEIVELVKNFKINKLIYILNLNDISPLAFQSDVRNLYDPNQISQLKKLKKLIIPLDKRLRGYSSLYTYLRMQLKNYFVLKQSINVSGFKAIELEPIKYKKEIKNAAKRLALLLNNLDSNSVQTCVLILPYEMQISDNAVIKYKEIGVRFEDEFLDFKTQKIFIEAFKNNSSLEINYLGNNFQQRPVGHFYVFNKGDKIDFNHPNAKGHYVLSEEISERKLCI